MLVRKQLLLISKPCLISDVLSSLSFVNSDSLIDSFFRNGYVSLNDELVFADCKVSSSDSLILLTPQSCEPVVNPSYEIIFEDDSLLVVNKPAPLPVHPTGKYFFNSLSSLITHDRPELTIFPVHRLDRETSGVVIFAKSKLVASNLLSQFRDQTIKKSYFAIVHGKPSSSGSLTSSLVESSFGDIRDAVLPVSVGRLTRTDFTLVSSSPDNLFSLLSIIPFSGKKHQIRVHLSTCGFPIVGDKIYGVSPSSFSDFASFSLSSNDILKTWFSARHLLHCSSISFSHPISSFCVSFKADIPKDMLKFMKENHLSL